MRVWLGIAGIVLLDVLIIWAIVKFADGTRPEDAEEGYEGY